jgi:hypothetical protein
VTLAADLIPVVDDARTLIQGLGFRVRSVVVRTTTRAGVGVLAVGTETHSDVTLTPRPRVRRMLQNESRAGGLYEAGDLIVDRISATYSEAQLDPSGNVVWLIDGEPCKLIGLELRALEWMAIVRRTDR